MNHSNNTTGFSAEDIAEKAMAGEDISGFFTNAGTMCSPIQKLSINIGTDMLNEIDRIALDMNVDRQAFIKTCLRQSMDQHYLARKWRKGTEGSTREMNQA